MEIVKEVLDNSTAVLKVSVQPEDYKENVNAALKDYARKANLPGFRPGKVPLSVIKNMVGKAIVLDELNKTLYARVNEWVKEQDIEIIGEPLPQPMDDINLDPDANTVYAFQYEIGLVPEFVLNLNVAGFPDELTISVDDEFVAKEIETLQKRQGKMENPEVSIDGDLLFGFLTESEKETYVAGKRLRKAYVLNPDRELSPGLRKRMVGQKTDDVLSLHMSDLFSSDAEIRDFWEEHPETGDHFHLSPDQHAAVKEMEFFFEVKKVNRIEAAPLDQEFFDKVIGPGKATNEEEFRTALKADLQKYLSKEGNSYFRSRAMKALIEGNDIQLSTSFLRKWLIASRENVNDQNVDEMLPTYLRDLRWSLIVNAILKSNPAYKITDEDIKARSRALIEAEYGITADNERMEGLVDRFLEDKDFYTRMTMNALDDKVFDHIRATVNPAYREITASEFVKMQ